ncbi:hypothetical protein AX774_g1017 [Zancudomyces culisetae]|uniref:Uncharacterized protein n=1 Tax=Zancudomyces culisetae TaxID=1213189 RepID=A0A1R1PCS6_ZANCU|nr:hypothetical protein AX774_g7817 [Zancudomyces culisetae]OMH85436.1 hypothetical protein AX774_g1017 [Zancudomyces culisetae]|eukprot:OMH78784.1 hypothetical protein AX774_g7817 [Zancudomyces culisetae]
MIKSAVLSALVLSSTFAYNVQNEQNQDVQASGENNILESNFNEMDHEDRPRRRRVRKLNLQLFYLHNFVTSVGSFNAKPNKCYAAPRFASARMSGVRGTKGAMMFCSQANCTGRCFVALRSAGSQVNFIVNQLGGVWATSYSWIAPYF